MQYSYGKKQTKKTTFSSTDELMKSTIETIESLDNINIHKSLKSKHRKQKEHMITMLNNFCETYMHPRLRSSISVETYLEKCLFKMDKDNKKKIDYSYENFAMPGSVVDSLSKTLELTVSCESVYNVRDVLKDPKCRNIFNVFKKSVSKESLSIGRELGNIKSTYDLNSVIFKKFSSEDLKKIKAETVAIKNIGGATVALSKIYPFNKSLENYGMVFMSVLYKDKNGKLNSKQLTRSFLNPIKSEKAQSLENFNSFLNNSVPGMEVYDSADKSLWFKRLMHKNIK